MEHRETSMVLPLTLCCGTLNLQFMVCSCSNVGGKIKNGQARSRVSLLLCLPSWTPKKNKQNILGAITPKRVSCIILLTGLQKDKTPGFQLVQCLLQFRVIRIAYSVLRGFPDWLVVEEPTCQSRRCEFSPWVGKIPWRWKWQLTPALFPGKSHGQKSLAGYSPLGCRESDMIQQLSTLGKLEDAQTHQLKQALGERSLQHLKVLNVILVCNHCWEPWS